MFHLPHISPQKGFTLIETLVVIGILSMIMAIVIVAINPKRHFDLANDTQRKSSINELKNSFMQYFIDNKTFPSSLIWSSTSCSGPVPSALSHYLSTIPCDPDTSRKYVYQPLDAHCQPCQNLGKKCTGFRIMATLKNTEDSAIVQSGCDPVNGCGFTTSEGDVPNYGLSSGCKVATSSSTIIVYSTPNLTPSPKPTITGTITPASSLTPAPTIELNITPISSFTPNSAFDETRASDLLKISLALEKYRFLNGSYPICGNNWQNAKGCLTTPLSILLNSGTVPDDPENGDPYIYIAYSKSNNGISDGFCLGANLADPNSRSSEINCPINQPIPIYSYRIKERGEIIFRPTPNLLTEEEKAQKDALRIIDMQTFIDAMERYKQDNGHYPNCWMDPYTWATTGAGDFFCGGQFTSYSTGYNFDPGGINPYVIVQWDPGPDGYFRKYCFGAYMDKGENLNCRLDCPVNNYSANYCYFPKNP